VSDSIFNRVGVLRAYEFSTRRAVERPPHKVKVRVRCPSIGHDDEHPSCDLDFAKDAWKCHACGAGGGVADLIIAAGHAHNRAEAARWLEEKLDGPSVGANGKVHTVAEYEYRDENGALVYVVERRDPKSFVQKVPDGKGGWRYRLDGVRRIPYRLPELRDAIARGETICVVEGEQDAEALAKLGVCSTTSAQGAAWKWPASWAEFFRGVKRVVILPDCDEPGRKAAQQRASIIALVCADVRVLDFARERSDGYDVSDWLGEGHAKGELLALADAAPRVKSAPIVASTNEPKLESEPEWGDTYPWPILDDAGLYGLAGEIVRLIEPHSEADPAALLAHILVSFGAFVGSGPHFEVEATPQPARLFALVVGDTANARKGTARNRIEHAFRIADEETLDAIRASGLSSGEGLIEHLCDKQSESGEHVATEKRALVQDSEFARILAVAGREGNTLSAILRGFWDEGKAQNMTRKNPLKVRGAHVCHTADITLDEFAEKMPGLEIANGLLNRYLIVCSKRSKLLPFGGDLSDADLALVAGKLRDAIDEARTRKRLYMTPEARAIWAMWYGQAPPLGGLLSAATARRDTQALRLALTYALLDRRDAIDAEHLRAAFAFWDYCFASARHLFGSRLGDPVADRLLRALRDAWPQGLDGRQIDELFSKSLRAGKLDAVRDDLERQNLIYHETEPPGASGGRPRVPWYATPLPDKPEKPGQTEAQTASGRVCPDNPVCPEATKDAAHRATTDDGVIRGW
jgi:hypothetical protein